MVVEELGHELNVIFHVSAPRVDSDAVRAAADDEDPTFLADEQALFTAIVDARNRVRVGERLELALNPQEFHFFDPATGAALLRSEDLPLETVVAQRADAR